MIEKVAFFLKRKNDQPNIELAQELAKSGDKRGIAEIAAGLRHENAQVAGDCVKVLYELAELKPELVASHVVEILALLKSRNNRLVWGGMIALAAIAPFKPAEIFAAIDLILKVYEKGSTITVDNAVSVFAKLAAADSNYAKKLLPVIFHHLETCRPSSLPQHAERAAVCLTKKNPVKFISLLENRKKYLTDAQRKRIEKLIMKTREP